MRSCSAWMVATMSCIRPVRWAVSAARSAPLALHPLPRAETVGQQGLVEHLVVHPHDLAAGHREVTAGADAHPLARRRLVESSRLLSAPVDEERTLIVVTQAEAADVPVVGAVGGLLQEQAAEHEPRLHLPQLDELVLIQARERVALAAGLMVAADALTAHPGQPLGRLGPKRVQALVQAGDDGPFAFQLGFLHADRLPVFQGR